MEPDQRFKLKIKQLKTLKKRRLNKKLNLIIVIICLQFFACSVKGTKTQKFSHDIGYISSEESFSPENFKRCGEGRPRGFYSSSFDSVYVENKFAFKEYINKNIKDIPKGFSGYISFRFLINCEAKVGRIQTKILDLDFNEITDYQNFAETLRELLLNDSLWRKGQKNDMYMYLLFRFENGKLHEIIP